LEKWSNDFIGLISGIDHQQMKRTGHSFAALNPEAKG